MAKKIKFALDMGNGYKVRTLDDLQEHFDIEKLLSLIIHNLIPLYNSKHNYNSTCEAFYQKFSFNHMG